MTDDLPIREPDEIRQDCARKLRAVQVSDHFQGILGCLLGEDWTTPRLVEMSGIVPVPLILEDRIGSEMALLLIDKTPFIYTLAKVKPFDRMLKTGMVATSHGPLAFLLFSVPKAGTPDDPYFAHDYHLNPFNTGMMATWRDLARQSHWHLLLIDVDREVQDVFEFDNVYGLGEALDQMTQAVEGWQPGNYALAKQEFCDQYSLSTCSPCEVAMPTG